LRLAQETIKYIVEVIKETVELASQSIDSTLKTILEKGNDIQKEAQGILRKLLQSVVEEIEKAKQNALEAGADITECISGQEDAAKEAVEEVTQEIVSCISDKVRKLSKCCQSDDLKIKICVILFSIYQNKLCVLVHIVVVCLRTARYVVCSTASRVQTRV
jgi:phage-related protein